MNENEYSSLKMLYVRDQEIARLKKVNRELLAACNLLGKVLTEGKWGLTQADIDQIQAAIAKAGMPG